MLYRLGKKDGKTKDRVDEWRRNIAELAQDQKKGLDALEAIEGNDSSQQGRGGEFVRDYFGLLVARVQKDVEELVRIC